MLELLINGEIRPSRMAHYTYLASVACIIAFAFLFVLKNKLKAKRRSSKND